MQTVIDQLKAHRSIRKFTDKPVADTTLDTLVAAAQCAATSHHVQACTIIRVNDPTHRKAIASLAGPQPWVEQAPVFLVFCADLTRLIRAAEQEGQVPETGWAEQLLVATVDTALVAQNLMVAAESVGIGGVFIGGIRNDPATVANLLAIPDQAFPVFGMCLGYPAQEIPVKPRLPLGLILRQDRFDHLSDDEEAALTKAYDRELALYYLNRGANLKETTWTRQMARFMAGQTRPHMKAFLEQKGFFRK